MNKYRFVIGLFLKVYYDQKNMIADDEKISQLFNETFNELDWIVLLMRLELIYGMEIPDELSLNTELTLSELTYGLSKLPLIPNNLYPEFYDIKILMAHLMNRSIELEDKTDMASKKELVKISKEMEDSDRRLKSLINKI